MSARWLGSPLAGTAGVLVGLCLLAIPLHKLTSANPAPVVQVPIEALSGDAISGVIRLKLLAPAKHLTLKTSGGDILLELQSPAAGETEHDAAFPMVEDQLEVVLNVDFGVPGPDSAVFLTVMPDAYGEQTRYAIGSGDLTEILSFDWRL